jgi:hypothetical protein
VHHPYGTQEGEISFCAYNTGIGWRNIIENMHQNATVAKWYRGERPSRDLSPAARTSTWRTRTHGLILNEVRPDAAAQAADGRPEDGARRSSDDAQALSGDGIADKQLPYQGSR